MSKRTPDHSRAQRPVMMPIKELRSDPDFQHDPQFQKLVTDDILGKGRKALTRLPAQSITSGFYVQANGGAQHISNYNDEHARLIAERIKEGARFPVEVYWNALVPGGGGYASPDGEAVLGAYRLLGIKDVPTWILRPKSGFNISEGAVWIRKDNQYVGVDRIQACRPEEIPAYTLAQDITAAFETLRGECATTLDAIIKFHEPGGKTHYHQMIHACVRRHSRFLESINSMISSNRLEHAYILTRSAYEGFLNFYVDWLSPEFFGPRLQLLSKVRMSRSRESDLDPLGSFKSMLESIVEKAKI